MPKYNDLIQSLDKPEKNICIYALLDPDTNELKYIGQTIQGFERIREHYNKCNKRNKSTNQLSRSKVWINKLKKQNKIFKVEYLEYFDNINDLDYFEEFWISYFKFLGCNLLNDLSGGNFKRTLNLTKLNKNIISIRTKEAMNNPITKEKCRQNMKKQRELGLLKNLNKLSESTKNKISKAQDKKVIIIQDEDGNIFRGLKNAAKYYDVTFGTIWKALNGYCKTVKGKKLTILHRRI